MLEKLSLWFKINKTKQYINIIHIDEIKISEDFRRTKPRYEKVIKKTKYIDKKGYPEKPICVDKNSLMLRDGYIDYLVCKALEVNYVPVRYV